MAELLVFGTSGQVARELARLTSDRVSDRAPDALFLGRDAADLRDPGACAAQILRHQPAAVINAAAYTAVDRAESEEALARIVNAEAPAVMAQACANFGIPFLHISTDYVFAGDGTAPWRPSDPVSPQNAYGRTKLAGEEAVRGAGGVHGILRTSWVVSAHGANFVKTMLRLGAERERLTVVADQVGGLTPASAIAAACLAMVEGLQTEPNRAGTYHFAGAPDASWADIAREVFAQAGMGCAVEDIPTSAYPTPAARPLNSRLDCSATETVFGVERPDWRAGLREILAELGAAQITGDD